jgi:YHS domain-containing protein
MTPLRLLILAVLFYIGWQLIKNIFRKKFSTGSGAGQVKNNEQGSRVEDVLVEDPVCHKLVPRKQAIRLHKNGEIIYFCSENCCDIFTDEPGKKI